MMRTTRRLLAGLVAIVLTVSIAAIGTPAYANPVPLETSLAERTNPAVHIITTEYSARVSLRQIKFSRDGQRLILLAALRRRQGELRTARSFIDYVFDRVQRNPTRYLAAAGRNRTQKYRTQYVGSSFIATPDGYLVTARHVVTPDREVNATFARAGAAAIADADTRAVLRSFRNFDLSTGAMRRISRSIQIFARAKVKVKRGAPKVSVRLGVASGNGERVAKTRPAEVVYRSQPSLGEDVAVLRIRVDGQLPTIDLAENAPLQGSAVYINAFPAAATYVRNFSKAAKLQPTLSKGTVTAVKSTKGGLPLYQTDANASGGSSGGAAFDDQGKVVGILVSGVADARESYLMPLEAVRTALTRSGATVQPSQTSQLWEKGLADYHAEYYSKALGEFQEVRDLYPAHAYVGRYIADSQSAINQGKDKTPVPVAPAAKAPAWRLPVIIGAGALVLVAALVVTALLLRRRRRAARSAVAGPAAAPAPAYLYNDQSGASVQGQGYGGPVPGQEYGGPVPGQGYGAPAPGQGYSAPAPGQGYGGPFPGGTYGGPAQPMPPNPAWTPDYYGQPGGYPSSYPSGPASQATPPTQAAPPNQPPDQPPYGPYPGNQPSA